MKNISKDEAGSLLKYAAALGAVMFIWTFFSALRFSWWGLIWAIVDGLFWGAIASAAFLFLISRILNKLLTGKWGGESDLSNQPLPTNWLNLTYSKLNTSGNLTS